MNKTETHPVSGREHLSVIHKAQFPVRHWLFHLHDAVVQTDLHFKVTGWNMAAEQLYGQPGAMDNNLFELVNIEFISSSMEILKKELAISGCWGGEVVFKRYDEQEILLQTTANYIYDENYNPLSIVFVSHNISEVKKQEKRLVQTEEALRKSNERFEYAARVTSDAIWDVDIESNQIYRSNAFHQLSGYKKEDTISNLDWWFDKIHPDDQERVTKKFNEHLVNGIGNWQDEYRFLCADGSYKYLIDRGIILFENKKPVRIIGAIEDITQRKQLEEKLLQKEIQKQRQINQATLIAQEQERSKISEELHDNVNQILMSAKLFMETALKKNGQEEEMIQKAIHYQCYALEEIRKISKALNSSLIKTIGFKDCIGDIIDTIRKSKNMNIDFVFDDELENRLTPDQKLMLFRIIQEQTNNIIKHAAAGNVQILTKMSEDSFLLVIADDGKGFDPAIKKNGIGLTNIMNRTHAFNGEMKLDSAPGKGCRLEVNFPLS
jgi:PAS domain S-box-containing protein